MLATSSAWQAKLLKGGCKERWYAGEGLVCSDIIIKCTGFHLNDEVPHARRLSIDLRDRRRTHSHRQTEWMRGDC